MIVELGITDYEVKRSMVVSANGNCMVDIILEDGEIKCSLGFVYIKKGDISVRLNSRHLCRHLQEIVLRVKDLDLQGYLIKGAIQNFLVSNGVFPKMDEKPLADFIKFLTGV